MAARRRKRSFFQRIMPVLTVVVFMIILGAIGYGTYLALPAIRDQIAKYTSARSLGSGKPLLGGGHPVAPTPRIRTRPTPSRANGRDLDIETEGGSADDLRKQLHALQEENRRLRNMLETSSETIARRETELDELRLRLLILERTRARQP